MASISLAARPWSKAAFDLAGAKAAQWAQALRVVATVAMQPKVAGYIANPQGTAPDKVKSLLDLAQTPKLAKFDRYLEQVIVQGRAGQLINIADRLDDLVRAASGARLVAVTCAHKATAAQKKSIESAVAEHFDGELTFEYYEDADLIGGFIAKSGDQVVDASVSRRIERLAVAVAGRR